MLYFSAAAPGKFVFRTTLNMLRCFHILEYSIRMLSTLQRCQALLALTGLDFRTVAICKIRLSVDKTGQSKYNFQLHMTVSAVGLRYKKSRGLGLNSSPSFMSQLIAE